MTTILFYVHGYNSSIKPEKISELRSLLPFFVIGLKYDSSEDFQTNLKALEAQIARHVDPYKDYYGIMGASLGGFYAQMLGSKLGAMVIMLNPSLHPKMTLKRYLGENTNFVTGETYLLTQQTIDTYPEDLPFKTGTLALLSKGDEVLDSIKSAEELKSKCQVELFDGGEHRFRHFKEAAQIIDVFMNTPVCHENED